MGPAGESTNRFFLGPETGPKKNLFVLWSQAENSDSNMALKVPKATPKWYPRGKVRCPLKRSDSDASKDQVLGGGAFHSFLRSVGTPEFGGVLALHVFTL